MQLKEAAQEKDETKAKVGKRTGDVIALVVMIVLTVLLLPIFVINLTLIIKGSMRPDVPPDVFGVAPLAVTSGSMDGDAEGSFPQGSLIFVRILDDGEKQELKEGDVVTFHSEDNVYVTHRIIDVMRNEAGAIESVVTKGDANAASDGAIPVGNIVGICTGSIAGLGEFSLFLQTPVGIIVFIGIPVLLFIVYDVTRIALYNRRVKAEQGSAAQGDELESARSELRSQEEELNRLRAQLEKYNQAETQTAQAEGNGADADGQPSDAAPDAGAHEAAAADAAESSEQSAKAAEKEEKK